VAEQNPEGFRFSVGGRPVNILTGPSAYCNSAQIVVSFFDFNFDFNQTVPVQAEEGELPAVSTNLVQRIVMSPQHAKAFLNALQQNVDHYERQFGQIPPAPQLPQEPPAQEDERETP
jgi:hypothetical protein